jgi:hypothetical protein
MTAFESFMTSGGWALFAACSAVFAGGVLLVNQFMKLPGQFLVLWSRIVTVAVMLPFIGAINWPGDWKFYAAVALTAVFAGIGDIRTYDVASKHGGGVVARLVPLSVWGAFLLWFVFDPGLLLTYAAKPFNTGVILVALGGCVFFAQRQNKCDISRAALKDMLPAIGCYVMTVVLNKYSMSLGEITGAVFGYITLQSFFVALFLGGQIALKGKKPPAEWLSKKMLLAAAMLTALWIAAMAFKNYTMPFVPSPSYPAAIGLTSPVFIALFYRLIGHKEKGDVKSGMGIVACAVLLALATVRK